MLPVLAAVAGAQVLGGALGAQQASKDRDKSLSILQRMYDQYAGLKVPTIEEQMISPEGYTLAQEMLAAQETPEALAMRDQLENVSLDPRLKKTQMDNLAMLEKIASSGGMTPEDKASLQLAMNKVEQDANARNQALLQQQEARGVGSSDMATAMRAQTAQSAANRASEAALTNQIEGRRRALEAMTGAGSLAANLEQADYGRQAALAQNLNAREQANVQARNDAQQRNIAEQNAAQRFNIQNKQNVSNLSVESRNLAEQKNKALHQTQYQNQLDRLAGMSGQATGMSRAHNEAADRTQKQWSEGIGAVTKGAMGLAGK